MKVLLLVILLVAVSVAPALSENSTYKKSNASYINGTTSMFLKVIKTEDVRSRDPIYVTPAVVFIGKKNGDILRCLQRDPGEYEVFYQTGSPVYSLLISGEYIYAGLLSGTLLRCELTKKGSCSTFHTFTHIVMSLTVVGGYLHAGIVGNSTMMRCTLNQPHNCWLYQKMQSELYALIPCEEHICAGIWTGQLMRCSLRTENSCTQMFSMKSCIMGFANFGNSMMTVTSNGQLWNCSYKSDLHSDFCVQTRELDRAYTWDIASYNGLLYIVNNNGIFICSATNETQCSNYGNHIGPSSIAFAYSTFHMQSRYRGENTGCTWQDDDRCPPLVTYYKPHERSTFEVHVKHGRLRNSVGNLVDTSHASYGHSGPAAIFAMGPDGRLLLSNVHVPQLIHTSSLFAGQPVAGVGEMVVENGVIKKITTCSDHYRPNLNLNRQVIDSLRRHGYTAPIDLEVCSKDEEYGLLPYEAVNVQ